MKQMLKNCLTVLLVLGAALVFSLQLRWLDQKGASRYSERMEQMHTVTSQPLKGDDLTEGKGQTDIGGDIVNGLLTNN
ncbi:MAG: hypothetical protein LUH16_01280 [Clostridiales bacterium]|nr:hypothetical protein [Clostridiales bacterium]